MANTFKFGNKKWAVKKDYVLAYNDENNNFKPLPFDFTRDSTATYVDSDGLIKTAGEGIARIDYTDNTDGHLLLEPIRTNLVTNSVTGTYGNSPGSESNTIAPDGTNTAVIPTPDSLSDRYNYAWNANDFSTDTKLTYSWYRKRLGTPQASYTGDLNPSVLVNATQVGSTEQIASDINGYDRFSATFNVTDGSLEGRIRLYFGGAIGIGNSSIAYWGHQVETGSYATSYIPTSGTSVTRAADARTDVSLPSNILSQTEGTIFFNINRKGSTGTANQELIVLETPSRADGGLIRILTQTTKNVIRVLFQIDEGIPFDVNVAGTHTPFDTDLKIAIAFKSGQSAIYINGVSTNTSTSTFTIPETFDNFYLNFSKEAATFKDIKLYNTRLSNSELETLTTL